MTEMNALDIATVVDPTDDCATCATHRAAIRAATDRGDRAAAKTQQTAADTHVHLRHARLRGRTR